MSSFVNHFIAPQVAISRRTSAYHVLATFAVPTVMKSHSTSFSCACAAQGELPLELLDNIQVFADHSNLDILYLDFHERLGGQRDRFLRSTLILLFHAATTTCTGIFGSRDTWNARKILALNLNSRIIRKKS